MRRDYDIELDHLDRQVLSHHVWEFRKWYEQHVRDPVLSRLGCCPQRIFDVFTRLKRLDDALQNESEDIRPFLPYLQRVYICQRRRIAAEQEARKSAANDPESRKLIAQPVEELARLIPTGLFHEWMPAKLPGITDFLTLECIQGLPNTLSALSPRKFDEKFGILCSPSLIPSDLSFCRDQCELRGVSLVAAFLDIDDFKDFNANHTETAVDAYLLPRLMALLERHVYGHGYAYRLGGDEYFVLLPNADADLAVRLLAGFQTELLGTEFSPIKERPTVSIGICLVDGDCFLTDIEVREKANVAKNLAKEQGKNRIAAYSGWRYEKSDLSIVSAPARHSTSA